MPYEFRFPDVGEGITEGEIVKWRVKEGDTVKEHDVIAEIETDKAIVQIPSPKSGKIAKLHHREGDTIHVGETLATIAEENEQLISSTEKSIEMPKQQKGVAVVGQLEEAADIEPAVKQPTAKPAVNAAKQVTGKMAEVLPAVRRLARELNADISSVKGTGKDGRITEEDVRQSSQAAEKKSEEVQEQSLVRIERKYDMYGYVERVPLKGIRKATAKNMVKSMFTAPHVTHMDEADVTELSAIREKEKAKAEKSGIKLTFLPFVVKAAVAALKAHPYMNASMDDEHGEIILKSYYNIGIAIDTTDGLIVPVIKEASEKTILEIAKEIQKFSEAAKDRKIDLADMKGGTFTITNVGSVGGLHATPIINWPEAAIIATGRIYDKAVVAGKKIVARKMMPLSVSFDHRIVDGVEAARFTNTLKEHLEDPELLLIEGR
ncbi:MAG: 2-oxo acid dehydrogenase subunit E2 [Candidatus Aenigmarchaeota archaeon]|nr:2-oxo acid dehydrogenase subunit E2 [Candidatus Aenigmarchaeota archaeon]